MKNRSELREIIIKILYQKYVYDEGKIDYSIDDLQKEFIDIKNEFIDDCLMGIIKKQKEIESMANIYLKDWNINRLSKVDKAIISLGIFELLYTDTPEIVVINEAIELAKKYSDDKVVKMINATLDKIYHNEGKNEQ